MAVASKRVTLPYDIESVWRMMTNLTDYSWRSDVDRIEILDNGRKFVEYTKGGHATLFTVTLFDVQRCWAFDMENDNIKGNWLGVFTAKDAQHTIVDLTETVNAKKALLTPILGLYIRRQQAIYIADLKKALAEK